MARQNELLNSLADTFDDGRTFDGHFLREHDVSADECVSLSSTLATIIRGYLRIEQDVQNRILLLGVTGGPDSLFPGEAGAAYLDSIIKGSQAMRKLEAMNRKRGDEHA